MERQYYIDLIYKKLEGGLSAEDQSTLSAWLESSPNNQSILHEIKQVWEAESTYDQTPDIDLDKAYSSVQEKIISAQRDIPNTRVKSIPWSRWAVAAVSILGLCIASWMLFASDGATEYLADGQIRNITLKDGSTITLDRDSRLLVSDDFNKTNRNLSLEGRAFFDVTKNKDLPFVVNSQNAIITVLGTQFTIKEEKVNPITEVSVSSGQVSVKSKKTSEELNLIKNQSTRILAAGALSGVDSLSKRFDLWRNPRIKFSQASIIYLAETLSAYYNVRITTDQPLSSSCEINASFIKSSLEEVIEHLESTYGIEVEQISTNQYHIHPGRCK